MIDAALAAARTAHFAATLLLEGTIAFRVLVAEPVLTGEADARSAMQLFDPIAIGAFVTAILSGAAWLLLLAAEIGGSSINAAVEDGTTWLLLTQTQFGIAWQTRAAGFLLLAICMIASHRKQVSSVGGALGFLVSVGLAGSIAWSGHGAATPGRLGNVHVALDFLHLAAAGLWLGGLLPFLILLLKLNREAAFQMSRRFSAVATASVLVLLPTGIANGWFALDGIDALTGTLYGQLLLAKITLFLLMLAFAAVNRFVLVPQLAAESATAGRSASRLAIHTGCEIALGLVILAIVAVLGIVSPVEHQHSAASYTAPAALVLN